MGPTLLFDKMDGKFASAGWLCSGRCADGNFSGGGGVEGRSEKEGKALDVGMEKAKFGRKF